MTDPTIPAENPAPARSDELTAAPPVDLAWALSQMSGLVLSRETVDTALELVTALAATATAGTGLLAAQAAILLANSQSLAEARRLSRQLTDALASRDVIAQATGVLLAQGAAGRQDAFATLAATARRSGRSIEDVARAMLAAVTARHSGSAAP
jgi:ANTAR domain-containing protein